MTGCWAPHDFHGTCGSLESPSDYHSRQSSRGNGAGYHQIVALLRRSTPCSEELLDPSQVSRSNASLVFFFSNALLFIQSFFFTRFSDDDLGFPCDHWQLRARIQVIVLSFVKALTASDPAVSNLVSILLFLDLHAREEYLISSPT